MYSWELRSEQDGENVDFTIVVSDAAGKEVMWIAATEVIEGCSARFVFQHALECVRQGVWPPDADGIMLAGEIPCWAQSIKEAAARKDKHRKRA